ncbi:hypothetical protein D9757_002243 [Collybiopsis confluens]|uniref:Ras GEF n=1 Tax=Collybiopsis confluens TaxID=2823264 RepID=A0A8H5HZT9_9AGAR|nr:hypothetical protein D9757_002243 [Collybiopsis confluens]
MSVATASRSHTIRQPLHISIDPPAYSSISHQISPDSAYTSESSSARPSSATTVTSPSSSGSDGIIYSVLCMYDFASDEPTHLSFAKNEILDIIKREDSGWWAAMRRDGDIIGWIPQAFVKPLSEEMADRLLNVRQELRIFEYEAEQLYVSAPVSIPYEDPVSPPRSLNEIPENPLLGISVHSSPSTRPYPPPSPVTPMPQPPPPPPLSKFTANRPTPPTPRGRGPSLSPQDRRTSTVSRQPLHLSQKYNGSDVCISPEKRRDDKIRQLTGSNEALDFHNAVLVQANLPWYLKPRHADELQIDADGKLISGTRIALVERLVWDTIPSPQDALKAAVDTAYRRMFLTTFRTFMLPEDLFDMLVDLYRMPYPENMTESEFGEWRDRCLEPTQKMILTVFTMWLEEHRLLEEEPQIARLLTEFLELIQPPSGLAVTAQLIVESIARLTFSERNTAITTSPVNRRKKYKTPKNDLLSIQPSDIAEQLAVYEFKLYSKLSPQDCMLPGPQTIRPAGCTGTREALSVFCATHDRVAAWVTDSILSTDNLAKRSDTVDHWIKVAEKCRNLNNFASMSAIINALSSTVITRLHLTWAHVGRKNTLDALSKYNEPSGGFPGYRYLHLHAEGPCVPFIGMYLTDLVHIKDQQSDENGRINILQRQKSYEVILIVLRTQSKPYNIVENDTMKFIQNNLRVFASPKDWQSKFWQKSQDVQHSELAHADIRRGLERAGF